MSIRIEGHEIGLGRTFVIAEIGNNHNGSFDRAIELIDGARAAGADCAKFQMRHLDEVYRKRSLSQKGEDLGTEYIIDLLGRFNLGLDDHRRIATYCAQTGILYLCTPWDARSVDVLEDFGVPAYKVASADLTNIPLLDQLSQLGKPLILSTGMSTLEEIEVSVNFLSARHAPFVILHCNSTYPSPLYDINLQWMNRLREMHQFVGYSGHERGINISLAAVALGACVIERHFTLDRNMEGPDHAASLTQVEFRQMVEGIREIEQALGSASREREVSQGEMINRENLRKSLVAARPLAKGTVLTAADVSIRSPGQGLSPQLYDDLIGRTLGRDMEDEDFFFPTDINDDTLIKPREYKFSRPWGIPVRYHDFRHYASSVKPDLWEFHMSYSDMELDPAQYLYKSDCVDFVVHAPELFSGSRLMDLANPNDECRIESIRETQRVIDITRSLKRFFPKAKKPLIVANVGGFSMDARLEENELPGYYKRFSQSLHDLNMDGVELVPQTMAPFPWHFGGQRYQNLFVRAESIAEWCSRLGIRMCFDVSHSKLACNYYKDDFYDFAMRISPFVAHIHFGDAKGLNGEGLQIGDGDIDFERLGNILRISCPTATFIPEIWQGHKNGGEGFWRALEMLEGMI